MALYRVLMNGGAFRSGSNIQAALSYCVQQVRSYDYHHYICLLHLPPTMRKAAFTLRAFNVETAKAMDVTSDPKIGLMRLLWWKDAIDKVFSQKKIEHPVALALSSVILEQKISKSWLKRSVEARINDANREISLPQSMEEIEKYAEDTMSTLLYMTLQAGGIHSSAADHVASHIGKASGLLLLLKSLPYHASRVSRVSYIPEDIASKHGLLIKEGGYNVVKIDPNEEGLSSAVFDIASVANNHLQKARNLAKTVPAEAFPVFLPAVPVQIFLDALQKSQFNVFDPRLGRGVLGVSPLWFQLKLKWHAWRGSY